MCDTAKAQYEEYCKWLSSKLRKMVIEGVLTPMGAHRAYHDDKARNDMLKCLVDLEALKINRTIEITEEMKWQQK